MTQESLYENYKVELEKNEFQKTIFIEGGDINETVNVIESCKNENAILIAFGGGSVLDIVKYCASKMDKAYITVPSTLSNDAIYSCVSRLIFEGKKTSYGVQPPMGIIVDLEVIRKSPQILILAGVADLVSNLSAIKDWLLAYKMIGEPINELAFMLAKEAAIPMFSYKKDNIYEDKFLLDLTNGLITSGLSMIVSGDTRGTSGAEHLISHAIDEYFPEKSGIHGIQVGWAHLLIEKQYRSDKNDFLRLESLYKNIGLSDLFQGNIPFSDDDLKELIPYGIKMRNRYTILNLIQ
ncbi:MAG: iron-containing alcohol dehydrogenase [Bacteroidales bacterium]|nr:iron-containing alcohol dehydrogenase [Bacteroidales bacterium]